MGTTDLIPDKDAKTSVLLDRARKGKDSAWEALYRRYRTLILVGARVRIPGFARGRFDHEDLLHTAFLKALKRIDTFEYRGEGSFRRWLTQLVVTSLRDRLRRDQLAVDPVSAEVYEGRAAPGRSPDEAAEFTEEHERILNVMSGMDEAEQDVLCMRIFEGLSWKVMGEILECDAKWASRRFDKAMVRLTRMTK